MIFRIATVMCLTVILNCSSILAADATPCFYNSPPRNTDLFNSTYWMSIPGDFASTLKSPFVPGQQIDLRYLAVVGGIGWYLMANDKTVSDDFRNTDNSTLKTVLAFGNNFGDAPTVFAGLGVTYLTGNIIKDKRLEETALLSFKGVLISGTITQGVKYIAQRHRPVLHDPNQWDGPGVNSNDDTKSFPSGHATAAWTLATIVAKEYADDSLIPLISYSLATTTCLARVQLGQHWPSDVFVGAVIGYWVGNLVYEFNHNDTGFCLYPYIEGGNLGAGVQVNLN